MGKTVRAGAVVVAVAILGIAAVTSAGADDKDGPFAPKDCTLPRVKPTRIVLFCGDAGAWVNAFTWRYWGNERAKASAVLHAKTCRPDCATGGVRDYPVNVKLHKVRRKVCNGRRLPMFQKIKLTYPGKRPGFADRLPEKMFCTA